MRRIQIAVGTAIILLCPVLTGGCTAGTATELLTFDNVIGAAQEAKKGVVAYDQAVRTSDAKRQAALMASLGRDVRAIAVAEKMPEADADALAQRVVKAMQGHFANYLEQERRRDALYRVTVDNLDYIIEISRQGKEFSIYRADVSAQWKAYLQASLRNQITKADAIPPAITERTPSND